MRPIADTSSNPAVVSSSTRAPLRSSSAFVPTVVPSVTDASAAGSTPADSSDRKIAAAGSAGVEGTFATVGRPVSASSTTRSLNVPPVSMPAWSATSGVAVTRQPVVVEQALAAGIAEVGALAAGLGAPDAPEERPSAQPAGSLCRAAPVDLERPPLAHLEDAVAVVEVGRRLAPRERVGDDPLEAELLLGPRQRRGGQFARHDDDAVLVAAHEVARRDGDARTGDRLAPAGDEGAAEGVARRDRGR